MIWVLAFFAGLMGAAIAIEAEALFGFGVAGVVTVLIGRLYRQSVRIDELMRRLESHEASRGGSPPATAGIRGVDAAAPREPAPVPAPVPAPAADAAVAPLAVHPPAAVAPTGDAPPRIAAARARASDPAAPRDPATALGGALKALLFEGNVPVKLGLLVTLLGVAALVRYAAQSGWLDLPVPLRYAGIALVAIALLVYGLREARERPAFGLSLQGGAIGMLLLVVFGSYRLSALLPAPLAFAIVLVVVIGTAILALRQNAVWLAAIGFLGGYAAPILLSTGSGDHVALFTYYAVLNAAVFGMAWIRPWRALNLIGFAFNFGVGALWGARHFQPDMLASTAPFLAVFLVMYVLIPVAYALKGREPGKVDATLFLGTPLLAFPMQVALLDGARLPLALSALAVAALYATVAYATRRDARLRVLAQTAAAMALSFATLAVPLGLSAAWTSATWALQGLAMLWIGLSQQRRWLQGGGMALQALAGFAGLTAFGSSPSAPDAPILLDPLTLNLILLAVAAGASAWLLDRRIADHRTRLGAGFTVVALGWWFVAGFRAVLVHADRIAPGDWGAGPAWLLFVAGSAALVAVLRRNVAWRKPAWLAAFAMLTAPMAVAAAFLEDRTWLAQPQGLALVAVAAALAVVLPRLVGLRGRLAAVHLSGVATLALGLGLGIREALASAAGVDLGEGWRWTLPWVPLALFAALLARRPQWAGWPVGDAVRAHRALGLWLSGVVLGLVWLAGLGLHGSASPLPWVPLLNPLELFQLAGVLALAAWHRGIENGPARGIVAALVGFAAFMAGTMATLRAVHHWAGRAVDGMPWLAVVEAPAAQAALSVVWALAGVACWIVGSRRGSRALWGAGAGLLVLVLTKLLLVDRANLGDLLGIASFLAVGALLVLVGRIAPRPPARPATPVAAKPRTDGPAPEPTR